MSEPNDGADVSSEHAGPVTGFETVGAGTNRMKVWSGSGSRLLGRALAVPFAYADLYRNPDAARRGEFDPYELLAGTTCAANGGEDDS